jgi:hypothetical protein
LPDAHDEERLLYAMGFETANIHLGTPGARATIRSELRRLKGRWLRDRAEALAIVVRDEWARWRAETA